MKPFFVTTKSLVIIFCEWEYFVDFNSTIHRLLSLCVAVSWAGVKQWSQSWQLDGAAWEYLSIHVLSFRGALWGCSWLIQGTLGVWLWDAEKGGKREASLFGMAGAWAQNAQTWGSSPGRPWCQKGLLWAFPRVTMDGALPSKAQPPQLPWGLVNTQ